MFHGIKGPEWTKKAYLNFLCRSFSGSCAKTNRFEPLH
jgi:hypothetical protein